MRTTVIESLKRRIGFYADLVQEIDDETIRAPLDVPKHRSVALHLWCVVGTRESYAKAIAAGEMQGWSSSATKLDRAEFIDKLHTSGAALLDAVRSVRDWTPQRERLLAEVAEHEVMHEGQIIRVMFGLEKELPASCSWAVCG